MAIQDHQTLRAEAGDNSEVTKSHPEGDDNIKFLID